MKHRPQWSPVSAGLQFVKPYLVGGAVRDDLLGMEVKDLDYVMVSQRGWPAILEWARAHITVYQVREEYFTIRGQWQGHDVDFVMAREDGPYEDGRRPSFTVPAKSIEQDLARRDFTCNAIAQCVATGGLVDPFKGADDIRAKVIRPVVSVTKSFVDDGLRVFRALRLAVCKGFELSPCIQEELNNPDPRVLDSIRGVSPERIRDELERMMRFNSEKSVDLLFRKISPSIIDGVHIMGVWFTPSLKRR